MNNAPKFKPGPGLEVVTRYRICQPAVGSYETNQAMGMDGAFHILMEADLTEQYAKDMTDWFANSFGEHIMLYKIHYYYDNGKRKAGGHLCYEYTPK